MPKLEIYFDNGDYRIWDTGDKLTEEKTVEHNIATETDIFWDDLTQGLTATISINRPIKNDNEDEVLKGFASDHILRSLKGSVYVNEPIAKFIVLSPDELEHVVRIDQDGKTKFMRIYGEAVAMTKIELLAYQYLSESDISALETIGRLAFIIEQEGSGFDHMAEDNDDIVAQRLGVTKDLLLKAKSFAQASFDSTENDFDDEVDIEELDSTPGDLYRVQEDEEDENSS